jgi:CubicO group peptidase (beta-lactamase class C family)
MNIPVKLRHLIAILLYFFLQLNSVSYAQSLEHKIDSLIETKFKSTGPGATFLVSKNGELLYRKAFGEANLELNVPMKPENVFKIGSMTKQFTAISILMLMEEGKLSLDDELSKYISDYPMYDKKITIHHLLTHTSGIKNYTSLKAIRDITRNDLSPIELIDFFKNEPMDFEPGEQFKYNNSGYVILGHIIELVSGQSYEDFVGQHIFKKLQMISSQYASHTNVIKNRASGYHNRDGYVNSMYFSLTLPYAAGSLMSTVDDLLKWQEGLNNNSLVSSSTIAKVFTNYTLNNGEKINYGYGWHLKDLKGLETRQHGGSIFGFKSMGVYIPSTDIYVIGLTNCDCNSPTEMTKEIAVMVANATN